MKFLLDNIFWIATAFLSGGMLLFPALLQRGARIGQLQATQLMNQGKAVIIDVRDPAEFSAGHLRDARNIPLAEIDRRAGELDKFKSKTAIVVCQSGTRSSKAAAALKKAGFNEVYSLEGGLAAWQAQGLPVTK